MTNPIPGSESIQWNVNCQYANDGSGDLIVPLPEAVLAKLKLATGDTLTVEIQADGTLRMTPVRAQKPE